MPFANAAANAINTPTKTNVAMSVLPNPTPTVEAISRFEGPAKGIRFNPKAVAKIIMKSIGEAMRRCPLLFAE